MALPEEEKEAEFQFVMDRCYQGTMNSSYCQDARDSDLSGQATNTIRQVLKQGVAHKQVNTARCV